MIDLGTVRPGSTVRIPFSTFDKDDGSSITMTNYAAADILVYKDGSTTERASTAGFTATTDFDTKTGKHLIVLDLADNTTADFWKAGSEYLVALDAVTVDTVTTGGWVARFRIGYPHAWFDTSIATLSSQTSFTLTAGPAEDDALNGTWAIIHDAASAVQCAVVEVLDYTGSTRTVTLAAGATFTAAAGDNFSVMGVTALRPATIGRTLAVGTSGQADANVTQFGGSNATATGGRPEVNASHAGGTAWGSGAITAASIATGAIDADALAADAVAELADGVWDEALSGHATAGSAGAYLGDVTDLTTAAAAIADAVWDEAQSGHVGAGTFGEVATEVAAILVDTAEIGAAGAGLTALATAAQATAIETDTQDLQSRIPAALVAGRIDASVGAMAANVMTAAAAAADLTTELQSGLATAAALSTVSGLVDDLESRLTATRAGYLDNLSGGAVALQSAVDTLEASATAIEADTQDIQSRLPAALVGGRMDATVDATGMEAGAIDAILDDTIGDGTLTVRQALRVLVAGMAGKLSGAATTTITIRNVADTADVVVATVDSSGNRSAVTVTP